MSVDGRIDDASPRRLVLSNEEDLDRVDAERARADAILVGAGTLRADDPRLLVRSEQRGGSPIRVTLTRSGLLDPGLRFFTVGETARVVYCPSSVAASVRERLGSLAVVVGCGDPLDLRCLLSDLAGRGVRRLMVEGGGDVNTQLLAAGLVDELHLVVAPFFVGDAAAPRFVGEGAFPHGPAAPMMLGEARRIGDSVLLRYLLTDAARDRRWLEAAVELSRRCPPSRTAFSVGAVIVDAEGRVVAEGWSRETDPTVHAEESALAKVAPGDPRLAGATMYSSLEPCGARKSRSRTCAQLIHASGIRRVVYALREPSTFVEGRGDEQLRAAGVTVVEIEDMGPVVRKVNAHLLMQHEVTKATKTHEGSG
jgi:5-amino-6-(5-phosphoribosylamino)uracil reductase